MAERRGPKRAGRLRFIPVRKLARGRLQPRRVIDGPELTKLAQSIRADGLIQPILVRRTRGGKYEVVAGERRWLAAKLAGLESIPCLVTDVPDRVTLVLALIENLHRADLSPIDQALAIQQLVAQFSMTHREIADGIGKSRATVTNLLRLLELPENVRSMLAEGSIDMGHARALLGLPGEARAAVANRAARDGLSVRAVERIAREHPVPAPVAPELSAALRQAVRESLRGRADVQLRRDGRCRLRIDFTDVDELHRALSTLEALLRDLEIGRAAPARVGTAR